MPSLELAYMGIHPHFRGKGLGRLLLLRGLAQARREGFASVTLAVDSNNGPALSLYESMGFRENVRSTGLLTLAVFGKKGMGLGYSKH